MKTPTEGDLRVCHIPQIPGRPFIVDVPDLATALLVQNALADYDLFQLEENIKPDFCNVSWIDRWENDGECFDWLSVDEFELEELGLL